MFRSSMRSVKRSIVVGAAVLLVLPGISSAQNVVWFNGVPDNLNGHAVNGGWATANNFTLLGATTLGSFDWYVLHLGTAGPASISSNFTWRILADVGGAPGAQIASASVVGETGTLTPFFCCGANFNYQTYLISGVSLGDLMLGAGTYWLALSLYSSDYFLGDRNYWAQSAAGGDGHGMHATNTGGAWVDINQEGAFTLFDNQTVIPEPASLALLATGLFGVGGIGRFRRFARRHSHVT